MSNTTIEGKGRSRPLFAFDHPGLRAVAYAAAMAAMLPIIALIVLALSGHDADWAHIIHNVLPGALTTTFGLMAGVALLTAAMGITTAWLTVHHDFPARRFYAWALVLPLAVPPYLAAYSFAEFLHYTGPVQTLIRAIFGFTSRRDYWFPDVRSLGGTIFVMSCVLYPYVYLATRATFLMQGRNAADVARTLGASPARAFFRVMLPMARPAIVVGISLALMETLNDVGAVEYLGVRTLSSAVYTTWLNQGSLSGAAQIACVMLLVVLAVVMGERWARRRQRFTAGRGTAMVQRHSRVPLAGWRGLAASFLCAVIIIFGFGISLFVLGGYAVKRLDQLADPVLQSAILTSIMVAALAALITVVVAFMIAYAVRVTRSPRLVVAGRIAAIGYAVPGTVLALGILIPLARFDNLLDGWMQGAFGFKTGLLLTGSAAAIVYAMSVRFLAMAEGAVDAGFHKIPTHIDMAARTLGRNARQTLFSVLLPLLKPAFLTAGLFVFIDTIKELSATILLRPFGYNSLATYVYERASRAAVEDASVAALLIMLAGIIPVIVLTRTIKSAIATAPLRVVDGEGADSR